MPVSAERSKRFPLIWVRRRGVAQTIEKFPAVDILINNLGIFDPKPFELISDQEWMKFFEVNVLSGVRLSRHYLPRMAKRNGGRIIFISSESGVQIPAEMIPYGMTKTAQLAISRGLAETTAGTGRVARTYRFRGSERIHGPAGKGNE